MGKTGLSHDIFFKFSVGPFEVVEVEFQIYCTLVSNAKGNVAKSNKSELLNRLSYRGLPYHFEVRRKSVRNDCKISRSQPQKFDLDFHSTSTTSKGLSENSKKKYHVIIGIPFLP